MVCEDNTVMVVGCRLFSFLSLWVFHMKSSVVFLMDELNLVFFVLVKLAKDYQEHEEHLVSVDSL